jgi:hypothetical protein
VLSRTLCDYLILTEGAIEGQGQANSNTLISHELMQIETLDGLC